MKRQWSKRHHVKSSMENDIEGYSMFLGRWQPLHEGHKQLFDQELKLGKKICIMIRDTPPNDKNPFTSKQVKANIENTYKDMINSGRVVVMVVPNIISINFGRGVGYDIVEHIPPSDISKISATKIRKTLKEDGKL